MAINKKLIHFATKSSFLEKLNATPTSEILDHSIVFIKETGQIWTHGKYYNCTDDWNNVTNKPNTLAGYGITDAVDTYSNQTIGGHKSFDYSIFIKNGEWLLFNNSDNTRTIRINYDSNIVGNDVLDVYSYTNDSFATIKAKSYIVNGGNSSQFLKADGV